jgi:hypothetical protein
MTPTEVLKMLKSKIDAAGLNKCNYAIETSDIEAINQALLLYDVVGQSEQLVLFADWLQYNGKWDSPEKQVKKFLSEQKQN